MSYWYILCPVASRTFFVHQCTMGENERVQFKLMLPADLKVALEDAAHENRRSLSAEIIARLAETFDPIIVRTRQTGDPYAIMEEIIERVIRKVRSEDDEKSVSED
jgi:hypothetical protein